MSHFARASIHKAVISYDKKYKTSDFETVTLRQDYANGTHKKKYCLVFTGAEGVEGLLQVKERFDAICATLDFNTGDELFTNFAEVLQDSGASRWQNLISDIEVIDRDDVRFNQEYGNLLDRYATNRGRDIMKDYLRSDEVKKRHDVECSAHSERMLTLCRYTNLLHGTTPAFTAPEIKEIVFKSFPFSWQQDYELSGRNFNTQELSDIVDYFGTLKVKKDQDETRKRHGGGRGSPGRGGFEH